MESLFILVRQEGNYFTFSVLVLIFLLESIIPYFNFFKSNLKKRLAHALRNFILGLLNVLMLAFLFVKLWHLASAFAYQNDIGALNSLNLSPYLKAASAVLLLDLWTYAWHRMNHEIPFFWKFHKVHHSDINMDVSTAFRFHIGEIAFSSILRTFIILLIGAELWHIALYEAFMFPFVQLQHANIALPEKIDKFFRIFFASPAMHKIHHSNIQTETDSNYTSFLSIWDRFFGSFCMRADLNLISFGINKDTDKSFKFFELIKSPFEEK